MNDLDGTVRLLRTVFSGDWIPRDRDIVPDVREPVVYRLGIEDGTFQFRVSGVTLTVPDGEHVAAAALFDQSDRMLLWVKADAKAGDNVELEDGWGMALTLPAANRRRLPDRRIHDRRATCGDPDPAHDHAP